jgi:HlyD family secretion protein
MLASNKSLFLAPLVGLAVGAMALAQFTPPLRAQEPARTDGAGQKQWAAVAPGRVEASSREIRIGAPIVGRIAEVLVKPNDKVFAGEVLIRLDDDEAVARLAVAEAQVAARKRARDDQSAPRGSAERRRAEDGLADAERAFADARAALDKAAADRRSGGGSEDNLNAARAAFARAQDRLRQQRAELRRIKADADTPLPNRTEGELNAARAELSLAELTVEKTRIRAPIAGTVLQVQAKVGEIATPSPDQPLVLMADVSALRVRAELDERDLGLVRVGQRVVVRANAFRGREFEGKVASIAQIVGPGGTSSRGPRKLTDVDVVEVTVDLTDPGPLTIGMQVDVYFRNGSPQSH